MNAERKLSFAVIVVFAASHLAAQMVRGDWDRPETAIGVMVPIQDGVRSMRDVRGAPAAAPQATRNESQETFQAYRGWIKLKKEKRRVSFELSSRVVDRFEGDPDIQGQGFAYQVARDFKEDGKACAANLELNGRYFRTCSGLYLVINSKIDAAAAPEVFEGDVFAKLERHDQQSGKLVLKPIGTFRITRQ